MKRSILAIFSFLAVTFLGFALSNAAPFPPPIPTSIPEPSTFVLLGVGVAGSVLYGLIKKRRR